MVVASGSDRDGTLLLSRRAFGGGLAAAAVVRQRGSERAAPAPQPAPVREPNLARVLRTKRLRLAGLVGDEPYSYKDPATGQWSGFCVTMARDLAAALGVELVVVESGWAELPADLQAGKIDLSYLMPTAQRGMFVDFANPLFYDTYAIVARKGLGAKSWAELNVPETLVAMDLGSAREEATRRFAGNAAITGFKTRDEAMSAVQSARADCFVDTVFAALTALKKNPQLGELVVPTPHLRAAVCPGLPYDDDRRFRGAIDAWGEDNRETGRIRDWIVTGLTKFGVDPGDLPSGVSF
jgi:polar amino acid transport system substrate-binding protein